LDTVAGMWRELSTRGNYPGSITFVG